MRNPALLWKVLRANISVAQIAGYALALLAGVAIVMIAAALYADGMKLTEDGSGKPLLSDGVRVLSKEVSASPLSIITSGSGFSQSEINNLESQPWVREVAPFIPSDFDASISADFGGAHFATALFFEAVPDEFYDTLPSEWGFDPSDPCATIILPADYLALYNFGFAPARGLPRLTEQLIYKLPLRVIISGADGRSASLPARIVGFSKRLNTIAVPLEFIQWANQNYGTGKVGSDYSRLIMIARGGSENEAASYFAKHRIIASGGSESEARLTTLLRRFTGVVATVGAALCLLSLFVMTLSLRLLVSKNKRVIQNLRLLGFSSSAVASRYRQLVILTNSVVFIISILIMSIARNSWQGLLVSMGATAAPATLPLMVGVALVGLLTLISCLSLGRMIRHNR